MLASCALTLASLVASPAPATAQQPMTGTSGDTSPDSAECLPAGGVYVPYDSSAADSGGEALVLAGGGWGHGVGMSQYGAQGAALLGCSTATTLANYYPGTTLGVMPSQRDAIAVHLLRRGHESTTIRTTGVNAGGGELPWMACDLSGTSCEVAAMQPAGSDWSVTPNPDGTFVLSTSGIDPSTCPIPADGVEPVAGCHYRGGTIETRMRMVHDGTVIRIIDANSRLVKYGFTEFDYSSRDGGVTYVTQYVTGDESGGIPALDRYLYGLGEMPSSWEPAALRAQAIAGRSYAEATIATRESVYGRNADGGYIDRNQCRCDLFATTMDQVYGGFDHESAETGKWKQAVLASLGTVMLYDNAPVAAFYSSSHGGSSEDVEHVWGTKIDYLPAVDTSRWEAKVANINSRDRWTATFTASKLASRFGLASFTSFSIDTRGPGGRPTRLGGGGVTVVGTSSGGAAVTIRLSGESLRSKLSLFSSLAYTDSTGPQRTEAEPEPTATESAPPTADDPIDISPACPDGEVPEDGSTDVSDDSVHERALDCIVWWRLDAPDEDGNFEAARPIRRDEMAGWLYGILEHSWLVLPEDPPNAFKDDEGNEFEFQINSLSYLALIAGTGDQNYSPLETVSRGQMAAFYVRLLERLEREPLDGEGDPFADDDGTTHEESITKLWGARVTKGTAEGVYTPGGKVTRAQMGSFAARVLARLVTLGEVERKDDQAPADEAPES